MQAIWKTLSPRAYTNLFLRNTLFYPSFLITHQINFQHAQVLNSKSRKQKIWKINLRMQDYLSKKKYHKMYELFENSKNDGLIPDKYMFSTLLRGCIEEGNFEQADKILQDMYDYGVKPDQHIYSLMMNGFGKCGQPEKCDKILAEMKELGIKPDITLYNTYIEVYAKYGNTEKIEEIIKEMERENVKFDEITFGSIIKGYSKKGNLQKIEQILNSMKDQVSITPHICGIIIDGLVKSKRVEEAEAWQSKLVNEYNAQINVVSYSSIIKGYLDLNNFEKAIDLFNEMKIRKYFPDQVIYQIIIGYLVKNGDYMKSYHYLQEMKRYNVPYNQKNYKLLKFIERNYLGKGKI